MGQKSAKHCHHFVLHPFFLKKMTSPFLSENDFLSTVNGRLSTAALITILMRRLFDTGPYFQERQQCPILEYIEWDRERGQVKLNQLKYKLSTISESDT